MKLSARDRNVQSHSNRNNDSIKNNLSNFEQYNMTNEFEVTTLDPFTLNPTDLNKPNENVSTSNISPNPVNIFKNNSYFLEINFFYKDKKNKFDHLNEFLPKNFEDIKKCDLKSLFLVKGYIDELKFREKNGINPKSAKIFNYFTFNQIILYSNRVCNLRTILTFYINEVEKTIEVIYNSNSIISYKTKPVYQNALFCENPIKNDTKIDALIENFDDFYLYNLTNDYQNSLENSILRDFLKNLLYDKKLKNKPLDYHIRYVEKINNNIANIMKKKLIKNVFIFELIDGKFKMFTLDTKPFYKDSKILLNEGSNLYVYTNGIDFFTLDNESASFYFLYDQSYELKNGIDECFNHLFDSKNYLDYVKYACSEIICFLNSFFKILYEDETQNQLDDNLFSKDLNSELKDCEIDPFDYLSKNRDIRSKKFV
ncbi:hypothetical protein GVAV_001524 [Gurleya vavrai]